MLDLIGDALHLGDGHGTVDTGTLQTGEDLALVKILTGAVLLHDHHGQALYHLIGGEPPLTGQTFPATANAQTVVTATGVDDFAVLVAAKGTFHKNPRPSFRLFTYYIRRFGQCPVFFDLPSRRQIPSCHFAAAEVK